MTSHNEMQFYADQTYCYLEIFPGLSSKEIESMFIVPRVCTIDNILKEFQFKILHRYLPTNDLLFKMEKVNSRKCTFYNLYRETILHLFYECYCVRDLFSKETDL